ncbi:MAG: hypothetical protein ACE5IY_12055 [bacterium]
MKIKQNVLFYRTGLSYDSSDSSQQADLPKVAGFVKMQKGESPAHSLIFIGKLGKVLIAHPSERRLNRFLRLVAKNMACF